MGHLESLNSVRQKVEGCLPGALGGGMKNLIGTVSVWEDEKVLEMGYDDAHTAL